MTHSTANSNKSTSFSRTFGKFSTLSVIFSTAVLIQSSVGHSHESCSQVFGTPANGTGPVRGLYDSIPTVDINLPSFVTRTTTTAQADGSLLLGTEFTLKKPRSFLGFDLGIQKIEGGKFVHDFSGDLKSMIFTSADTLLGKSNARFIDLDGIIPMIPEKGISYQTLVTLLQMKMAGVEYGSLREARSSISNSKTIDELKADPEIAEWRKTYPGEKIPAEFVRRAFPKTHSYQYFETAFKQSGHEVKWIDIEPQVIELDRGFQVLMDLAPLGSQP